MNGLSIDRPFFSKGMLPIYFDRGIKGKRGMLINFNKPLFYKYYSLNW